MTDITHTIPASGSRPQHAYLLTDFARRLLDLTAASLGLLLLAPLFLWLAWKIKRDSPGPVFYRGPRLGRGGRVFHILKFRTMYEQPDSYAGPPITARDDSRVTPLGKWLRDTKLNELPQLWNVLVGEMSLVGPRPEHPEIGAQWPAEVRAEVLSVRPGITSPASVRYRHEELLLQSGGMMESYFASIMPTKLRLDQLYVRRRCLLLDLDVIFWTLLVLLPRLGNNIPPEDLLFLGPLSRFGRRYLNWFVIDTLVALGATGSAILFFRSFKPFHLGWSHALLVAFVFALLFSLGGALMGINRVAWSRASASDAFDLIPPVLAGLVVALLVNYLWAPRLLLPVHVVLLAAALSLGGFIAVRYRSRLLSGAASRWLALRQGGANATRERVLIVGGGEAGQYVSWLLRNGRNARAFKVAGFVDDDLYKQGTRIEGVEVLGRCDDLPRLVQEHDAGLVLFAIHNITAEKRQRLLRLCTQTSARVVMVPDLMGALTNLPGAADSNQPPAMRPLTGVNSEPDSTQGALACQMCLGIPHAVDLRARLDELDRLAQSGDLAAVQSLTSQLRSYLQ